MKKVAAYFFALFYCIPSHAQVIPPDRFYDWTQAGSHGVRPDSSTLTINIVGLGAVTDSSAAIDNFIQQAMDSLHGRLGTIYFPAGTYLVNSPLYLTDSVVLKGASSDSTTLIFDLAGAPDDAMDVSKSRLEVLDPFTKILAGFQKGSGSLTVADAASFAANDYAEIRQENGNWDTQPASYAEKCVGQMVKVISISGNTLEIEPALRIDLDTTLNPEIRKIRPVVNVGVECMKIIRQDSSATPSIYNINFGYAVNCWVNGVESAKSMGAHLMIEYSKNITVSGSYFHHAFLYDGTGTRGYGVAIRQHASDCLIENNTFSYLRHAMMVKEGANGNVFAYNYSREPHRSEPIPDFSGDISLHGHYAFANLFEGNIVQNIIIDHVWGMSGPHNTFLRNRAELYGLGFFGNAPITANQNFVGNEITNTAGGLLGNYLMLGSGHFEYGNNVKGTITPPGTTPLEDSTYYLSNKPAFLDTANWVSIGIPNTINIGNIPARERYLDSVLLTVCALAADTVPVDTTDTANGIINLQPDDVNIYPNPAQDKVFIQLKSNETDEVTLTDLTGKLLLRKQFPAGAKNLLTFDLAELNSAGLYFLIIHGKKTTIKKLIIQ